MQFFDHCFIRNRFNLISEVSASMFTLMISDFCVNFAAKISRDQRCNIPTKEKKKKKKIKRMLEERNIIAGQEV